MNRILFSLFLVLSITTVFGQDHPTLNEAVSAIKKYDCILLFYDEHFATEAEKHHKQNLDLLFSCDFAQLEKVFDEESNIKVRISVFFVMCSKYRNQITEKHFKAFQSNKSIELCSGRNTQKAPIDQLTAYVYDMSKERKEKIRSTEALALVKEAQELWYVGPVDVEASLSMLQKADSLEPNNPLILNELANTKWNSELDIDGALVDFQRAIDLSLDSETLEMRYHNRGLTYLCMEDISSACTDWKKAGKSGLHYIEQYCNTSFDPIIHENPDTQLKLQLSLTTDTVYITHACNPTERTNCPAELKLENLSHPTLKIKDNHLVLGLENSKTSLFLEAVTSDGTKFQFVSNIVSFWYELGERGELEVGSGIGMDIDLTDLHHFPHEGTYRVRVVLRPGENIPNLTKSYYSNWQELIVIKRYERQEEEPYIDGEIYIDEDSEEH